jgi:hypothetical protein
VELFDVLSEDNRFVKIIFEIKETDKMSVINNMIVSILQKTNSTFDKISLI